MGCHERIFSIIVLTSYDTRTLRVLEQRLERARESNDLGSFLGAVFTPILAFLIVLFLVRYKNVSSVRTAIRESKRESVNVSLCVCVGGSVGM